MSPETISIPNLAGTTSRRVTQRGRYDSPGMLIAPFRDAPPPVAALDAPAWHDVPASAIAQTWRGDPAPAGLGTTAQLLWTRDALWIRFTCVYTELDIDSSFDASVERHGLWERDVCEVFLQSPHEPTPASYKEFEVAPTGQWFDAAIGTPRVDVDWTWNGGLQTGAAIDATAGSWRAVMRVPFDALGGPPRGAETWRANLFRIGRVGGVRHFLAYAPTGTPAPDFHVPAAFVPLVFTGAPA